MKAAQVLTFYRFAPFILHDIVDTSSNDYLIFKLLRRIILICFSRSVSEFEKISSLVKEYLTEWNKCYKEIRGFQPNHHFLVHLSDDIKRFGHPMNFSCMRFEGKHLVFKKISKKKQAFKNHYETLIKTYTAILNTDKDNLFSHTFSNENYSRANQVVLLHHSNVYFIVESSPTHYLCNKIQICEYSEDLSAYEILITDISATVARKDVKKGCMSLIIKHVGKFFILKYI